MESFTSNFRAKVVMYFRKGTCLENFKILPSGCHQIDRNCQDFFTTPVEMSLYNWEGKHIILLLELVMRKLYVCLKLLGGSNEFVYTIINSLSLTPSFAASKMIMMRKEALEMIKIRRRKLKKVIIKNKHHKNSMVLPKQPLGSYLLKIKIFSEEVWASE